jgi:hypothetical protein
MLTVNAVWRHDGEIPAVARMLEAARRLAHERRWS